MRINKDGLSQPGVGEKERKKEEKEFLFIFFYLWATPSKTGSEWFNCLFTAVNGLVQLAVNHFFIEQLCICLVEDWSA